MNQFGGGGFGGGGMFSGFNPQQHGPGGQSPSSNMFGGIGGLGRGRGGGFNPFMNQFGGGGFNPFERRHSESPRPDFSWLEQLLGQPTAQPTPATGPLSDPASRPGTYPMVETGLTAPVMPAAPQSLGPVIPEMPSAPPTVGPPGTTITPPAPPGGFQGEPIVLEPGKPIPQIPFLSGPMPGGQIYATLPGIGPIYAGPRIRSGTSDYFDAQGNKITREMVANLGIRTGRHGELMIPKEYRNLPPVAPQPLPTGPQPPRTLPFINEEELRGLGSPLPPSIPPVNVVQENIEREIIPPQLPVAPIQQQATPNTLRAQEREPGFTGADLLRQNVGLGSPMAPSVNRNDINERLKKLSELSNTPMQHYSPGGF